MKILVLITDESCSETYIKNENAGSSGGTLQPKDINTVALCAARCIDYVIGAELTCYGFDMNKDTNECTIFTDGNFALTPKNGVDNYRRNKACELPY